MTRLLTLTLMLLATPAMAADKMTLILDWFINPDHGPIIVAQEKGYFADQGSRTSPEGRSSCLWQRQAWLREMPVW